MKTMALALSASLLTAGMALAASETFITADADGDGALTMDEVVTAMPATTSEDFSAADVNGDGALTEAEFAAAMAAGLLRTGG